MSNSLRPHGLQHARLTCPSLCPGVCSYSCRLSRWCHLILCHPLLFLPSVFPASGSFPMCWLFTSGGQSFGTSVSTSVLPMNIQGWLPLELIGLITLLSKGLLRVLSSTTVQKHQFFGTEPSFWSNSQIQIMCRIFRGDMGEAKKSTFREV